MAETRFIGPGWWEIEFSAEEVAELREMAKFCALGCGKERMHDGLC